MVNIQEYLNEKYPINGACKRDSDKENKNKTRSEITKLDLSKGAVGRNGSKILEGSLKLEGFTNLQILTISAQQITELDLSTCPNLEEVDINNCLNLTESKIKSNLTYDAEKGKLIKGNSEKNNMTDNKNNQKTTTNEQPSIAVGSNVDTKLGNTTGDNAYFSNKHKSVIEQARDNYGATFGGSGNFNFTGGQNLTSGKNESTNNYRYNPSISELVSFGISFSGGQNIIGGRNENINQNNAGTYYYSYDKVNKLDIEEKTELARAKLGLKGKRTLHRILATVEKHAWEKTDWRDDKVLQEDISSIEDKLDYGELEDICQIKFREAKLEMKHSLIVQYQKE